MSSSRIGFVIATMAALLLGGPLGAAVVLAAVITPAVAEQQRLDCATTLPVSGEWRPPFQQAYTRTSAFGMRFHPIKHVRKLHSGIDLVSLPGPGPVVAASAGTVTAAGYRGGYGNAVDIDHGGGITTRYAHLARIHPGIAAGTPVAVGRVLGVEGSTGSSTGNHLHFEILSNGTPIDPVPFMADHGAPLDGRAVAPNTHGDPMRPAGRGGRYRIRPTDSRHPAPELAEQPGRPHPTAREGLVRRGREQVPAAVDAARRYRDGRDRPRAHHRNLDRRSARADAVHARHVRRVRGRRRRRRRGPASPATPTRCSRRRTTSPGPGSPRAKRVCAQPCSRTTTPPGTSTTSCTTPTPTAAGSSWATRPAALAQSGNPELTAAAR